MWCATQWIDQRPAMSGHVSAKEPRTSLVRIEAGGAPNTRRHTMSKAPGQGHDHTHTPQQPVSTATHTPPPAVPLNAQGLTKAQLESRVISIKALIADYEAQALDPTITVDDPNGATKEQKLAINRANIDRATQDLATAQAAVDNFVPV